MKTLMCDCVYHPADRRYVDLEGLDQFQSVNPAQVARLWGGPGETFVELTNNVILHTKEAKMKTIETLGLLE